MIARIRLFWLAALFLTPIFSGLAIGENRIFFSRSFPGSVPPYFEVTLSESGAAVYKEAPDDEFPIEFSVPTETASELFDKLEGLEGLDIPSRRKVAFTGDKILRLESEASVGHEFRFNYSEVEPAQELVSWFVKVAETERHLIELERVVQFDRLGVNKTLGALEASFNRDRVIAPQQFLPILKRIVAEKKIIHLARARAAALIERIEMTQ